MTLEMIDTKFSQFENLALSVYYTTIGYLVLAHLLNQLQTVVPYTEL